MIPLSFYGFMDLYWQYVLVGGILLGFSGMVYTATKWALAFKG